MTNKIICVLILMLSFWSCKTDKKPERDPIEKAITTEIDSLVKRYLELNRFSGTVLVTKGDTLIYNRSFGLADYENRIPFTNETAFKIGKISELVTANIIRNMAIEGKFRLTDKMSEHKVGIESEATINDVLNHKLIAAMPSSSETDKNDTDYNSLGLLIENISENDYQENIEQYSKGLGLKNTFFQKLNSTLAVGYLFNNTGNGLELKKAPVSDDSLTFSSNGLKSTAQDLVKIIRASATNELAINGYLKNDGFSYAISNNPETETLIIVLSNRRHPIADEIATSINAILQDKAYKLPLAREPLLIATDVLKAYQGKYVLNENVTFEVLNEKDSLYVLLGPKKVALVPQSENQFYMVDMDAAMRFVRDSTEKVTEVVLLNGFMASDERAIRLE